MSSEKIKILEMIQEGKVDTEKGLELLKAVDLPETTEQTTRSGNVLRVRVSGDKAKKVNLNLPLNVIKAASKFAWMGISLIPENIRTELDKKGIDLTKIDFAELAQLIEQGVVQEKIVDIDIDDEKVGKLKVEIYIE